MTIKFLSLLLLVFCALTAQGQRKSQWELGLSFSPDYSEKVTKLFGQPAFHPTINSEKGILTYSTSITISRKLGQRLSIGTGLTYAKRGSHSVAFKGFYYGNRFYDDGKTITDRNYIAVSYQTKFHFAELPLMFKYNLLSWNKLSLYPTVGFSSNFTFGVKNSTYVHYSDYTLIVDDRISHGFGRILFFSTIGGIGLDYNLNDNFSLTIQPEYRYYHTFPTNEGVIRYLGYKEKLYSFGTKFGLIMKF